MNVMGKQDFREVYPMKGRDLTGLVPFLTWVCSFGQGLFRIASTRLRAGMRGGKSDPGGSLARACSRFRAFEDACASKIERIHCDQRSRPRAKATVDRFGDNAPDSDRSR